MKLVRSLAIAAATALFAAGQIGAYAQTVSGMASGEVRKVDRESNKITIKHGEIKSLDMPPMTMVFTVTNPALFDKAKAGDKIDFNAVQQDGKIVVTDIVKKP